MSYIVEGARVLAPSQKLTLSMTKKSVPFKRRFASPSEERLRDPDYLSFWGTDDRHGIGWEELYAHRCVVVLGEGKCGKTHEFKQQQKRLRSQGRFAFFVPLEILQDGEFLDAISEDEEQDFERWQSLSGEGAVFFLDAIDELKLRKGTLRKALRKIKSTIGARLNRTQFFISCRPNDWDEELDMQSVLGLLAPTEQTSELKKKPDGEEIFAKVLAREEGYDDRSKDEEAKQEVERVKVVALLPLARDGILEFARLAESPQADALERYLNDNELWQLYQLPEEILSALDQLETEGRLGNLEEQLLFGVRRRLQESSEKKRRSLSEATAIEGAERLALSLFLMKRRSIYLDDAAAGREGVRVGEVLPDWTADQRMELLGKPLFDPTGVGAVRFHHRSTQEFLAARRLQDLRSAGLATNDLHQLLFATIADEKVVVPSMEPIAAWLALWNTDILAEVKDRNPLLLFRQGIPALLSLEIRAELLRKFVEKYAGSEWRSIGVGHAELKRVATPELAPVVRELWERAYTGHDTLELLLELVYLTPMPDCTDLAFKAAQDKDLKAHHRTYAAWSVLKFGTKTQKQEIGASIAAGEWPERVVRNVLAELLPDAIDLKSFLKLARSLKEVPNSVHGLGYSLMQAAKSSKITREQKITLRNDFSKAIWKTRTDDSRAYQAHSRYDHFVDALIAASHQTIPQEREDIASWAWDLAIAFHFGERRSSIIAKFEVEALQAILSERTTLREAYYWACFDLAEALEAPDTDWHRYVRTDYNSRLQPFVPADIPWLISALTPGELEARRGVAFFALRMIARDADDNDLYRKISELISDRDDLIVELEKFRNPPNRNPDEHEVEIERREKKHKAERDVQKSEWQNWRSEVLSDDGFLLDKMRRENTLWNLFNLVQKSHGGSSTWGHWDSEFVASAFSPDFLERIREAQSEYWRRTNVKLFSERAEDERNSFPHSSLMALAALKCEAEVDGWPCAMGHQEAVRATRIAMMELNGFGSFLPQLEAVHPHAVREVIEKEVQAQVTCLPELGHAPILHDLVYHGTSLMQEVAASCIARVIRTLETAADGDKRRDLEYAFKLIAGHGRDEDKTEAIHAIQRRLDAANNSSIEEQIFWIKILAIFDLASACEWVLSYTENLRTRKGRNEAIAAFAAVFGDRHMEGRPTFETLDANHGLSILKRLVIRAYQVVKIEDDVLHEGTYTPDTRDHAEEARGYLLQSLATTKSPKTLSVLYELSKLPEFSHLTDRLKQMATELAAEMSEPNGMNATNFQSFDKDKNYLPFDDQSLFAVVRNRLADFEHHLLNDEQSVIDTLRKVDEELELRRFISNWLAQNSRRAYNIVQEAVVIGEKRTDIRLYAAGLDKYASIEVKLDDSSNRWSGRQLRQALVDQLVGRYLNHERCRVGCLLICMKEIRRWQHPETRKLMDLAMVVEWLQGVANEMMEERPELLISVHGIDYSAAANQA